MPYVTTGSTLLNPDLLFYRLGLKEGMRVGDLGCGGHGQFPIRAAQLVGKNGVVYAVDILKSVLAEISKKARLKGITNIKPIWTNLELIGATAIPPATLDTALLINVLFQTKDRANIFREAKRLLKPGGTLLVIDWKTTASPFGPEPSHRIAPAAIQAFAAAAGLRLREAFDAGRYHYGMIYIR